MERKAGLYEETGRAWKSTKPEEIKETTELIKSITEMVEAMQANPQAESNLHGLKDVLEQPLVDFKAALFNPFQEGIYEHVSPLISESSQLIEKAMGTIGPQFKDAMQAIADMIVAATPFIEVIISFVESGAIALFNVQPGVPKTPEQFWAEAGGGAATGALIGAGIASVVPFVGTGIGALVGGIIGFFMGGWT